MLKGCKMILRIIALKNHHFLCTKKAGSFMQTGLLKIEIKKKQLSHLCFKLLT